MEKILKKCKNCGRELPIEEFYKNFKTSDGHNTICKECCKEYQKEYRKTPIGRAAKLVCSYKRFDRKHNKGEGDLTTEWVLENIMPQPCAHCGKTGWNIIGCNRLDNSKPHSKDNVEPCCKDCNDRMATTEKVKRVYQYTLEGELVAIWKSAEEIETQLGFSQISIRSCCNGSRKTSNGYKWGYE